MTATRHDAATQQRRRARSVHPQPTVEYTQPPSALPPGKIEGLDGLRALAVLAVFAYHLWPQAVPGGFIGVDVFFVISGFLITSLLLRELDSSGRIDLTRFWIRRGRRLLPALAVVVAVSIAAAWVVGGDLLVGIERQTLGAATFSTNWLDIAAGTDYFDQSTQPLFLTFWSLAVEEQFYLFWPVVVLGIATLGWTHTRSRRVALGLALASALAMALLVDGSEPTRVYYGTDTHAFGLMLGVAVAYAYAGAAPLLVSERWQRLRLGLPYVGIAVFAVLVAWLDASSVLTYRGGLVLASLAGLLLVACLPGPPSTYTELMRLRPLEWVGERSYGLYLWHWPVLLIVIELRGGSPELDASASTAVIVVAVTLALTEMSYQWIEAPIRTNGYRATVAAVGARLRGSGQVWPRLAAVGAIGVVAMAATGLASAPEQTEVQVAVEEGQALIESQTAPTRFAAEEVTRSAAAATTDVSQPAWPPRLALPPGTSMVGLGDSVMSGAAPALFSRFDGIYLEATPNLQWRDAPGMVDRLLRDGVMRPVVVLSFGTNAGLESQESVDALRATLDALGPDRRIVLVDVIGISFWVPSTNQTLRSIAAEYPNATVADWNVAATSDPGLLHDDRTHPNMAGIEVYTDVVSDALRRLGPR